MLLATLSKFGACFGSPFIFYFILGKNGYYFYEKSPEKYRICEGSMRFCCFLVSPKMPLVGFIDDWSHKLTLTDFFFGMSSSAMFWEAECLLLKYYSLTGWYLVVLEWDRFLGLLNTIICSFGITSSSMFPVNSWMYFRFYILTTFLRSLELRFSGSIIEGETLSWLGESFDWVRLSRDGLQKTDFLLFSFEMWGSLYEARIVVLDLLSAPDSLRNM